MAITLQENSAASTAYSSSGTFTNPLCITFDGVSGGEINKNLLVTNDDSSSVSNLAINITVPQAHQGYLTAKFKLQESDSWTSGPLSIGTLDGQTDVSFWIQLSLTQDVPVQFIKNLTFAVSYT